MQQRDARYSEGERLPPPRLVDRQAGIVVVGEQVGDRDGQLVTLVRRSHDLLRAK
ncbi:hypothetical protein [Micromonospora coxensis]|uniref:hypothetical protein n=1 Tax=Micromonospora coxensis TaxID=356852 RepID=UPI0018D5829E|nr:hypothetical protein [Micromonospora coxensis]